MYIPGSAVGVANSEINYALTCAAGARAGGGFVVPLRGLAAADPRGEPLRHGHQPPQRRSPGPGVLRATP